MAINDSCQIYEKNKRNGKMMIAMKRVAEDRRTYSDCANSSCTDNSDSNNKSKSKNNNSNNNKGGSSQRSGKFIAAVTAMTAAATAKTAAATSSRYMSHCQINAAAASADSGATTGDESTATVVATAVAAATAPIMTRATTAMTTASTRSATLTAAQTTTATATTAPKTAITTATTATAPTSATAATATASASSDTNTSSRRTATTITTKCTKPINSWQQQRQQCQQHCDCNRCNCCYCCVRQHCKAKQQLQQQQHQQKRKQQDPNAIVAHCPHEQHSSCDYNHNNNNNNNSNNSINNYNNVVAAVCVAADIAAAAEGVTNTEQQQLSASKLPRKYAKKTMPATPPTTTTTCAFCLNRLTTDENADAENCCWHQLLQRKIATLSAATSQHDSSSVVVNCNNKYNNNNDSNNSQLLPKNSTKQCAAATRRVTATMPALLCSVLPALRKHNWQQLFAVLLLLQLISGGHMSLVWAAEPPPLELVSVMLATNNNSNNNNSNSNNSRSGLVAKTAVGGSGSGSSSSTIMQGLAMALGISSSTTTTTTTTTTTMASNKTAITTKTTTTAASALMTTVRQQQQQQVAEQHKLLQQQLLASGNGTAAHPVSSSVIQLINRDAVLQRYNGGGIPGSAVPLHMATAPPRDANGNSCRSCQMREKAKLDSLESIKLHILMRLHLTQLPNITAPIPVPHNIIENFYRNYNATLGKRRRAESNAGRRTRGRDHTHAYHQPKPQRPKKQPTRKLAHAAHRRPPAQDSGADASFSVEQWHDYSETEEADAVDRYVADMLGDDAQRYQQQHPAEPALQSAGFYNLNTEHDGGELYDDDTEHDEDVDEEEEEEDDDDDDDDYISSAFYSRVKSVYIFPTFPRMRHNRKSEVLNFKFDHNHATIVRTVIHLYIRGRDWMQEYEPELLHEPGRPFEETRRHIVVGIHRAVRRPNALNFTHTVKLAETRHKIPAGLGQWVQIEVQQLAAHWTEYRNATLTLVVKCQEMWMRPFVVTGGDGAQHRPLTVHIEVLTKDQRRRKRSTSLDCQESDHEMRCCRYPLKVNFTNFGWHFVVAPTSFDAYFCNGECKVGYLEQYPHTHIASLTTSATPCCSPTKMSSLNLLYFDNEQNLVLSTIPNMSVEKCSCS